MENIHSGRYTTVPRTEPVLRWYLAALTDLGRLDPLPTDYNSPETQGDMVVFLEALEEEAKRGEYWTSLRSFFVSYLLPC